jgi:hypothetical protein
MAESKKLLTAKYAKRTAKHAKKTAKHAKKTAKHAKKPPKAKAFNRGDRRVR